jgi:hypothetical protein
MTQSSLSTGTWLLGFRWIGEWSMPYIYTEGDSALGAETRTVRHRLTSMSPFRNLEISCTRLSELIPR